MSGVERDGPRVGVVTEPMMLWPMGLGGDVAEPLTR